MSSQPTPRLDDDFVRTLATEDPADIRSLGNVATMRGLAQEVVALRARTEKAEDAVTELRGLLSEVYEAQTAACIGNGGPCGECLWCRVRAALTDTTVP